MQNIGGIFLTLGFCLGMFVLPIKLLSQDCNGLKVTTIHQGPSCGPNKSGYAVIDVGGAKKPYEIEWQAKASVNNSRGRAVSGLTPGNYTAVITDADGCVVRREIKISQKSLPIVKVSTGEGSIELDIKGDGPFDIRWFNGSGEIDETGDKLDGLEAGLYAFFVIDNNGCFIADAVLID